MKIKYLFKFLVSTIVLIELLNSCTTYFPAKIALSVSRASENGSDCAEGLQGKLTMLSDQTIIESPKLTKVDESFTEVSTKNYAANETVRLEAHCYDANGVNGYIIVEGKVVNSDYFKGNSPRGLDISLPGIENTIDIEYCITKDKKNIKIIDSQEPIPCVSPSSFLPDGA